MYPFVIQLLGGDNVDCLGEILLLSNICYLVLHFEEVANRETFLGRVEWGQFFLSKYTPEFIDIVLFNR